MFQAITVESSTVDGDTDANADNDHDNCDNRQFKIILAIFDFREWAKRKLKDKYICRYIYFRLVNGSNLGDIDPKNKKKQFI